MLHAVFVVIQRIRGIDFLLRYDWIDYFRPSVSRSQRAALI